MTAHLEVLSVECLVHGTVTYSGYFAGFILLVRLVDVLLSRQWGYTNILCRCDKEINWYWNWLMSDTVSAINVGD